MNCEYLRLKKTTQIFPLGDIFDNNISNGFTEGLNSDSFFKLGPIKE